MEELNEVLGQIGLNLKEAAAYLAVLQLGEGKVSEITKKAGIPRTTAYGVLSSLLDKGLLSFYLRKKRRYFVAEDPEKLTRISQERHAAIVKALPKLKAIYNLPESGPQIRFYEGKEGIKTILLDILEEKRPLYAATSIEDMNKTIKEFFSDFIKRRIQQHLPVKLLTNYSKDSLALRESDDRELRQTCFVPENFQFKTANYVYGNKVAIISLGGQIPLGIIIEDEDIAQTQKMFFEFMWEKSNASLS